MLAFHLPTTVDKEPINITAIWIPILLALVSMIIIQKYPISDEDVTDINRQLDEKRVAN
ncbi:hypothetical protein [Lactococcus sp.]|uniref:hypothetical protein n=1 Tax=Lactococcus sp. TaxID=44273 RepID=UPI0035AF8C4D